MTRFKKENFKKVVITNYKNGKNATAFFKGSIEAALEELDRLLNLNNNFITEDPYNSPITYWGYEGNNEYKIDFYV